MPELRFEGYVIVSGDGKLTDASGVMPDSLKFASDLAFFSSSLDRVDLIVHGRNSFEGQPNSPQRRRIFLTLSISGVAVDPDYPNSTLWNPHGASFAEACDFAGVNHGTVAVIGGPEVFAMFFDRYDTFWLSQAPHVTLPGGKPVFPGVPERSPQQILVAHGLTAGTPKILDAAHNVTVTPWRRLG